MPFIGIEPAIKPAALKSRSKKIGVLATRGTLSSALFANTSRRYAGGIAVLEQEGKGLVRIIESGNITIIAEKAIYRESFFADVLWIRYEIGDD